MSLPVDRRAARIAAAEQSLASAYAGMRSAGVDPDSITAAFAVARDCLAEARELSAQARRELVLAQYERDLARRRAPAASLVGPCAGAAERGSAAPGGGGTQVSGATQGGSTAQGAEAPQCGSAIQGSGVTRGTEAAQCDGASQGATAGENTPPGPGRDWATGLAGRPAVAGLPGDLCPDPGIARTSEEFMDALRRFRVWAGKPSFRAMERQCGRRFAASTMGAALRTDALPTLDMVHAIVTGCGGSPRHVHVFSTAWRRLATDGRRAHPGLLSPGRRPGPPVRPGPRSRSGRSRRGAG